MAQHCYKPATEAVEKSSKKRRRSCISNFAARTECTTGQNPATAACANNSFEMTEVFHQATFVEAEAFEFPSLEWSFDDDDCEDSIVVALENNTAPSLAATLALHNNTQSSSSLDNKPTEVLPKQESIPLLATRKKRKLSPSSADDNKPHMVRSIALSSHLADLASCWVMGAKSERGIEQFVQ